MDLGDCRKNLHRRRLVRWKHIERVDHAARYHFERNTKVPGLKILGRQSRLWLALWFLWQLALLDDWNLLPTGILMIQVGLTMTLEEFAKESVWNHEEFLKQRVAAAKFEYHVLRGQPEARIVQYMEADGTTTLYAV